MTIHKAKWLLVGLACLALWPAHAPAQGGQWESYMASRLPLPSHEPRQDSAGARFDLAPAPIPGPCASGTADERARCWQASLRADTGTRPRHTG